MLNIRRRFWLLGGLGAVALLAGLVAPAPLTPSAGAQQAQISGHVRSDDLPLGSFTVTLLAAGASSGATPEILGTAEAETDGAFQLSYEPPADGRRVLYLLAHPDEADSPIALASVLGPTPAPTPVVVNERTTVATAFALAQFAEAGQLAGPHPGITNAAGMAHNLADPTTGEVAQVLANPPNGSETSTINTFNSLANMVTACVRDALTCDPLLDAATPPGGPRPSHTFSALTDVARNPANDVADLFLLSEVPPAPYQPARTVMPDAWTLALRFVGDGHSMAGPGNFAIDHEGNLWVANNYQYNPDPHTPVCGSDLVLKFTPTGQYAPGSPYTGGGLSGAGFGVTIDPYGDVWVGNFGFAAPAPGCPEDQQPPHNSVSKFRSDGAPLSPDTGFTQGGISWPQGTIADPHGNIWIANCGNDTVTMFPGGDPDQAVSIGDLGLHQPFAIAYNSTGNVFVTGIASNTVAVIGPDGQPRPGSPITGGGLDQPMGIAADSAGNLWVANSGVIALPCPDKPAVDGELGSLTLLGPDGQPLHDTSFQGGGATIPWGIAVDGHDNVWVANFAGKRLSHFCGANPVTCPEGKATGDPISPDITGYGFDGLVRNTGVAVDPSGNVWLTNNWKEVPFQTNPGGYEIVAYVGMAPPVQPPAPIERPVPSPSPTPEEAIVPRFTG